MGDFECWLGALRDLEVSLRGKLRSLLRVKGKSGAGAASVDTKS